MEGRDVAVLLVCPTGWSRTARLGLGFLFRIGSIFFVVGLHTVIGFRVAVTLQPFVLGPPILRRETKADPFTVN